MTGAAFVYGPCFVCGQHFTFNPNWVPSVPIDPRTRMPPDVDPQPGGYERAIKQPLCENCIERVNVARVARGQEAIKVSPHAYEAEEGDW
jgi:hypothetical protein